MTTTKELHTTPRRTLGEGQFYIIVLPGMLHYIDACLYLIPEQVEVKLVFNGVKEWEKQYLLRRYPDLETSTVNPFPRSVMSHGKVLNQLIEKSQSNFGIIDYDLFLFSDHIFDEPEPTSGELAIGLYKLVNQQTGDEFPTTHFLYLNTPLIKRLVTKYAITAYQKKAPRRLRPALRSQGYDEKNFLKGYLGYFDTLNLIMALGIHDGYNFRFVEPGGSFHLGSTHSTAGFHATSYASYRLLSLKCNDELRKRYRSHYRGLEKLFKTTTQPDEEKIAHSFIQVDHFMKILTSLNFENCR